MKRHQSTSKWPNLLSKSNCTVNNLEGNHWFGFKAKNDSILTLFIHSAGETTYNLDSAGGLRLEVQKYYELIDALRSVHCKFFL